MGVASRVMYTIANIFTWIVIIACIGTIITFSLVLTGIIQNNTGYARSDILGAIIYLSAVIFFSFIAIGMVRIAKARGSSKAWDLLFVILGVLCGNIFYILGGVFGLLALR